MSTLAQRLVRQRGFLAALTAAGGVFAVGVVQQVIGSLLLLLAASYTASGVYPGAWTWNLLLQPMLIATPFAVGVLLSLWFIAPIASELRLFHVLTRALLAAAIGSALTAIVGAVVGFFGSLRMNGSVFGNSFPGIGYDGPDPLQAAVWGFQSFVQTFLSATPLVLLACVLLWIWLERHPAKHEVAGIIDDV